MEADKYALALMEALFTDEELAQSCYSSTSRSTKTPLPKDKIELLEGTYIFYAVTLVKRLVSDTY